MSTSFSLIEVLSLFWAPFLGGAGVALLSGPLGTLLVWQRLAYLGDALAHASLMGVGISLLFLWPLLPTTLLFTTGLALFLFFFLNHSSDRHTPPESLLLLVTQAFMGIGLLFMSWTHLSAVDLMSYFVGDFLTINSMDVLIIWSIVGVTGSLLWYFWPSFLLLIINTELALIQGVHVLSLRLGFFLLTSIVLIFAIQSIGILLVTTLLIFPILTLRPWVSTPERLCILTSCLNLLAMGVGVGLSIVWDAPPGPLISSLLFCGFLFSRTSEWIYKTSVPFLNHKRS